MIDRRELLHRAAMMLGGALSTSLAAGVLSGCTATPEQPDAPVAPPKFFTAQEAASVATMAELIIPKTDTPGAADLGVPAFIDRMMADFYQDDARVVLRAGLARADQDAMAAHGKAFATLTGDQQTALMKVYDQEAYEQSRKSPYSPQPHFFRMMKELTTVGYFTTEYATTKMLKYAPIPGPYQGDVPYSKVGGVWAL